MSDSADAGRGLLGSNTRKDDHPGRDGRIVERFALQSVARDLLSGERVAECLRAIVPGLAHVKVMHSPSVQRAHYKNLLVCASVWHCPVCAAKISERRRQELTAAMDRNGELAPALLTFTVQHHRAHSLKETLQAVLSAYKHMAHGKAWEHFRDRFALVGTVRALEVTFTQNGWHVHIHVLAFFDHKPNEAELASALSERWIGMVRKQDRFASNGHGVDVAFGRKAVADYVSKWGHEPKKRLWDVEDEVAKQVAKNARGKDGLSPFGLLRDYNEGNRASGRRFVEYAHAFKGARQLCWSRGLRARLGISKEKTDEELAKEIEADAVLLALLSRLQWRQVLANDIRGELLRVANAGDAEALWRFLAGFGIDRYQGIERPGRQAPALVRVPV